MDNLNVALEASLEWIDPAAKSFRMKAYDGGKLRCNVKGFDTRWPFVFDLRGMQRRETLVALMNHDAKRGVGPITECSIGDSQITLSGKVTFPEAEREITAQQQAGFEWQASIGTSFDIPTCEFVPAGKSVEVNGRMQTGPFHLVRKSTLHESSFVPIGAGDSTRAVLAAAWDAAGATDAGPVETATPLPQHRSRPVPETNTPTVDPAIAQLEAEFQAKNEALEAELAKTRLLNEKTTQLHASLEAQLKLEGQRALMDEVTNLCAQYNIAGQAIEADLKSRVAEGKLTASYEIRNQVLQAALDTRTSQLVPFQGAKGGPPQTAVMECALMLTLGHDEKQLAAVGFDEATLNAALSSRYQGLGLRGVARNVLRSQGVYSEEIGDADLQASIDYSMQHHRGLASLQASATTLSLPHVFENVLNKQMLMARTLMAGIIEKFCKIGSVNDYRTVNMYRVDASGTLKRVGPNGEAQAITLSDAKYTNQVAKYAGSLGITVMDIVNDDLNVFSEIAPGFMRIVNVTKESLGFTKLLSDVDTFWTTAKGNRLADGTSNALSLTSLRSGTTLFKKMGTGADNQEESTTAKDHPMMVRPRYLLTGSNDSQLAREIFVSTNLITGSDTTRGEANIYKGEYQPQDSPYLDSERLGNDTQWLLTVDPLESGTAPLHLVFLRGKRNPTIKRWDRTAGKYLISYDCDIDFGFSLFDDMASIYAKGKA